MNSFWRIFSLELTAFVRSRSLLLLLAASLGWMFAAPLVFRGDGTLEGSRQLAVHYSLGGVAALVSVALLAAATGAFARERAAKRLQLTLVRPVRYVSIAVAKTAALSFAGAVVIAASAVVEAVRSPLVRPCRHVLSPVMESPREEAARMYTAYMADPNTPAAVKKARPSVVLRLLAQRSFDRYESIAPGGTGSWRFALPDGFDESVATSARVRFAGEYGMRQDALGAFELKAADFTLAGVASNVTQSVVEFPRAAAPGATPGEKGVLTFRNDGKKTIMLRPRRDVNLLTEADSFGRNLVRASLELMAMVTLLVSFGVFLGASLSRPVALFTAVAALAVAEMSPSVIEQYPDELETDRIDAVGLQITRVAAQLTHPVSSLEPLAKPAEDTCVEPREVVRAVLADMLLAPLVFALLSSLVIPRKTESA